MGTAQNFFNATPAPDPQQNPLAAGVAGGLQGMANQGDLQRQMQLMQYQNQQKQMSDMLNAGAQNHQAGFGPGPDGSTPMQIGGQQGYWDPNGMSPAGQMDLSKSQLYQTMNNQKAGASQNLEAHTVATTLLKAIGDRYSSGIDKDYTMDKATNDAFGVTDTINKKYNLGKYAPADDQSGDDSAQSWQPGQPKTETQSATPTASAAQQMFSQATGSKSSATPRSARMQDQVQGVIDGLKKKGTPPAKIKSLMQQAGHDPSKYEI